MKKGEIFAELVMSNFDGSEITEKIQAIQLALLVDRILEKDCEIQTKILEYFAVCFASAATDTEELVAFLFMLKAFLAHFNTVPESTKLRFAQALVEYNKKRSQVGLTNPAPEKSTLN